VGLIVVDGRTAAAAIGSMRVASHLSTATDMGSIVVDGSATAPGIVSICSVSNLSTTTDVGPVVVDRRTTASAIGSMPVVSQLSTTTDVPSASAAISANKSDSEIYRGRNRVSGREQDVLLH